MNQTTRWDEPCVSTNGTHSPSATSNSARVAKFLLRNGTGERSTARLGPAMALRPVVELRHPRYSDAVIEADRQVQSHRYFAALPLHQADDRRIGVTHWHEIDQGDTAIPGLEKPSPAPWCPRDKRG